MQVQGLGFGVWGLRFRVLDYRLRVLGTRVSGTGLGRVQKVEGFGLRLKGMHKYMVQRLREPRKLPKISESEWCQACGNSSLPCYYGCS